MAAAARAAADRREGLARLAGQVAARRSRVEAGEAEVGRLSPALEEARERAARAQAEFTSIENQVAGLDAGEEDLDTDHEEAALRLAAADVKVGELRDEERAAEQERAALVARKDALELGLARKDGAGTVLAASDRLSGVLGSVAALLTVESGFETAIAAALGVGRRRGRGQRRRRRRGRDPAAQGRRRGAGRPAGRQHRPGRRPARRRAGPTCRPGRGPPWTS